MRLCKTTVVGNEELSPFLETPKLILAFIKTTDIGLKTEEQKTKRMHIITK